MIIIVIIIINDNNNNNNNNKSKKYINYHFYNNSIKHFEYKNSNKNRK